MVESKTNRIYSNSQMPNFVVWDWMREALGLSGANLMIFAYVFSQSFDGIHYSTTSLSTMEKWFGITRQTISRNLDKMSYVTKLTYVNSEQNNFKYNYYRVDMEAVLALCEKAGTTIYENFMLSYKNILLLKFPEDEKQIDSYFDVMLGWHRATNKEYNVSFQAIAAIVDMLQNIDDTTSFEEALNNVTHQPVNFITPDIVTAELTNTIPEVEPEEVKPVVTTPEKPVKKPGKFKAMDVLKPAKPKKESKQARRNREHADMIAMTEEFVVMYGENNEELREVLLNYLDYRVSTFITPAQWSANLSIFRKVHKTVSEMITGATTSLAAGYRQLAYENKQVVASDDNKTKRAIVVDKFMTDINETDTTLKELLLKYSNEVATRRDVSPDQFAILLDNLHRICPTTEQKIESVRSAYASNWSALAYVNRFNNTASTDLDDVDREAKLVVINEFFIKGFYFLTPEIKDLLVQYVTDTKSGRSMSVNKFELALEFLRLHCPTDAGKITAIKSAIFKDTDYLCREDFNDTKQAKQSFMSLENRARSMDRNRQQKAHREYLINPEDPRFKDFPDLSTLQKLPTYIDKQCNVHYN